MIEGQLSAGHARALLATPDRTEQERVAKLVVAEGLTVRQVEDLLRVGGDASTDDDPVDAPEAAAEPASRASPPALAEPGVLELEELLAARLETRVSVRLGKGPGKLVVEFADLDDLERIYRIITPPGTVV